VFDTDFAHKRTEIVGGYIFMMVTLPNEKIDEQL